MGWSAAWLNLMGAVNSEKGRAEPPQRCIQNIGIESAAINVGFDFRRYAIMPMPANPISGIAHVDGSGTAATVRPSGREMDIE